MTEIVGLSDGDRVRLRRSPKAGFIEKTLIDLAVRVTGRRAEFTNGRYVLKAASDATVSRPSASGRRRPFLKRRPKSEGGVFDNGVVTPARFGEKFGDE